MFVAVLGEKVGVVGHFDIHLLGELVCSGAGEEDVFGPFHYQTGELYRVLHIFDERHCAGF